MHSKILLVLLAFSISSCGMLGTKNKPEEKSNVGGTGCLDNSKDLVGRYVSGDMSQTEWKGAFDCINQSLDFFTQYVRGSNEESYSQGDMYTLISRFLITKRPVQRELMRGAFNLKQALFGGDASTFTKEQFELMQDALVRLQAITGDLIPYLKLRKDPNANYQDMIDMVNAFRRAGEQIADYVETLPLNDLSEQALSVLFEQLAQTLELDLIDDLDRKVFLAKWMMFNTRRDAIEGQDWPQFLRSAMTFAGIALSFQTSKNINNPENLSIFSRVADDYHYREFIWELFQQVKPNIVESLTKHNGNTPFPLFDHLIDELPDNFLNGMKKVDLKTTMREFVRKFLMSKTQMGVDMNVIDTVYKLGGDLVQDLGLLDRFYEKAALDHYSVPVNVMKTSLAQFEDSLVGPQKERFAAIRQNILNYKPLFQKNDAGQYVIQFQNGIGYTRLQNLYVVAADRVLKHLLRTYGSGDGYFIESDFENIFEQYTPLLFAIRFVDPTVSRFGNKRLQDIDLFTPVSDGNSQASIPEIIHYGMEVISAAALTDKMNKEITPRCDQNLGEDIMGWTWVPAPCFRNEFHKKLDYWISNFPRIKAYWATLDAAQQEKMMIYLEHGSRRNGYSDDELGKFDFGAFAAVLHYTESLFTRFDDNDDEILSKSEVKNAYPVFKNLLSKKAAILGGKDYLLKGVFTYLVKYKEMPITSSAGGIAKLGWWLAIYTLPTTKYSAERLTIANIVCQLAAPEKVAEADRDALNRQICAP